MVAYDMGRELPRTLRSLAPGHQRGIAAADYEVIVVDNGSPLPVDDSLAENFSGRLHLIRIDDAPPSPVRAANEGLAAAEGGLVGLMIDGARLASPGLLASALAAAKVVDRPVVATLSWHLGDQPHMQAVAAGYDQEVEDRLLDASGWEADGYRLFAISTLAGSSRRGWFGPLGESNALFLPASLWDELGGLDDRFDLPGGGLANHDLFFRACALPETQLVVLLGEGTFHQHHGGSATSGQLDRKALWRQYEAIRGRPYQPPDRQPLFFGTMPDAALSHLAVSAGWAVRNRPVGRVNRDASGTRRG